MAIQANKPNSRIFLLLGIVLAAAAAVAVLLLVRSNGTGNEVSVVVTNASVPAGTTLTQAMVVTAQVPATTKPGDAYTDPTAVVGKTTTVALATNTPLVPAFFSTPALSVTSSGTGSTALSVETQITKGFVALAIPGGSTLPSSFTSGQQANFTPELVSAAGYILPGDHLDILVTSDAPGSTLGRCGAVDRNAKARRRLFRQRPCGRDSPPQPRPCWRPLERGSRSRGRRSGRVGARSFQRTPRNASYGKRLLSRALWSRQG